MTRVILESVEGEKDLDLSAFFSSGVTEFGFCEFEPPLIWESVPVKFLHFSAFLVMEEGLRVDPFNSVLNFCTSVEIQKIKLLDPLPMPLPLRLNSNDSRATRVRIFLKLEMSLFKDYLATSRAKLFEGTLQTIKEICEDLELVHIALVEDGADSVELNFAPFSSVFFEDNPALKRHFLQVIVDAPEKLYILKNGKEIDVSNVPPIPKFLMFRTMKALDGPESESILKSKRRYYRRLSKIATNSGVAVDLLDMIEVKTSDAPDSVAFRSSDFNRVKINFEASPKPQDEDFYTALKWLEDTFNTQVLIHPIEAQLCSAFWHPALLLLLRLDPQICANFRFEWSTAVLFPEASTREVDLCVVHVDPLNNIEYPVLIVEFGKDGFSLERQSKDFSKVLELVSLSCIEQAYRLQRLGHDPEKAMVFGMMIGGTDIQLVVGKAVTHELEEDSGNWSIHTEISFPSSWHFSAFTRGLESSISASSSSGSPSSANTLESLEQSEYLKIIGPNHLLQIGPEEGTEALRELNESEDEESEEEPLVELRSTQLTDQESKPVLDTEAFCKLNTFIICVKQQLRHLLAIEPKIIDDHSPPDRYYMKPQPAQDISQASSSFNTPAKKQIGIIRSGRKRPASEVDAEVAFNIIPEVFDDAFRIYFEGTSYYPADFPLIYSQSDGTYLTEALTPLKCPNKYTISGELFKGVLSDMLYSQALLGIDCLVHLHIFHEKMNFIHGNITPFCIGFSPISQTWKFSGFERSARITDSKDAKLDVFAFGKVIFDLFYVFFFRQIDFEEPTFETEIFYLFEKAVLGMSRDDVERRMTVLEALEIYLKMIETFSREYEIISCGDESNVCRAKRILEVVDLKPPRPEPSSKNFQINPLKVIKVKHEDDQNIEIN